jgi:hypothetical protein
MFTDDSLRLGAAGCAAKIILDMRDVTAAIALRRR